MCVCDHNTLIGTDGIDRDLWTSDVTSLLIDKSCVPRHEERKRERDRENEYTDHTITEDE